MKYIAKSVVNERLFWRLVWRWRGNAWERALTQ
jgi:hypothetical protein